MKIMYRGNADERSFTEADFTRHEVKGAKDLTFKGYGDVQEVTKDVYEFLVGQGEPFLELSEAEKADADKKAANEAAQEASDAERLTTIASEAGIDPTVLIRPES